MWQELRQGLRPLWRNPLVAVAAILTLALGLGAATTAFTVARGALFPLDYPEPHELLRIYATVDSLQHAANPRLAALWNRLPVSYLNTVDLRRGSRTLRIGLYLGHTAVVEPGGEPLELAAAKIDAELLGVLGVAPVLGRPFAAAEVARREPLVLLGHDLWTGVFGADRSVLGRPLRVDGHPHTIVGVMPAGFSLPGREDALWLPAGPTEEDLAFRDGHSHTAVARLAPGAGLAAARAETSRLAAALAVAHPDTNADTGVRLVPLAEAVLGDGRRVLALLAAAAAAVLLVACVNLAHLLLARGIDRRGEMAVRLALGARRRHLLRQSAIEALALATAGAAGGLLLAALAGRLLPALLAAELPALGETAVDGGTVLFAFATALAATLLCGLLPALALAGVLLGALGALASGRLLAGLLYGMTAGDPRSVAAAALLLALACLAAGYLPARRASRIDPAVTLRSE